MKVLVIGAGGVGGYFGGRLIESGADVTFLVRERRARQLAENGLVIKSAVGDATLPVRTLTAADPGQPFDLVILTCKSYDLQSAIEAAAPHMKAGGGLVLPLLNGMAHIDVLRERFGKDRVLGGLCGIFATLSPAGEVVQMAGLPPRLSFGRFKDQIERDRAGGAGRRGRADDAAAPISTASASNRSSRACGRSGSPSPRWPPALA